MPPRSRPATRPRPRRAVRALVRPRRFGFDPIMDLTASVGQALGAASASSTTRSGNTRRAPVTNPGSRNVTAARALRSYTGVADSIRLPFNLVSMPVYTTAASLVVFGSSASVSNLFEIDPNQTISGWSAIGQAIGQIASSYRQFRMLKLTAEYEPAVPTSFNGSLALAYFPDAGYASVTSTQNLLSCNGSVVTPPGLPCSLGAFALDTSWKWTTNSTTVSISSERLTAAGAIGAIGVGLAPSTLIGYIRLTGVIELKGLGASVGTVDPNLASRAAASSSSSPPPQQPFNLSRAYAAVAAGPSLGQDWVPVDPANPGLGFRTVSQV